MAEGGRVWRTWQLAVVAAIALVVGIAAGAGTKTKTTTVSASSSATTTSASVVSTNPPVTAAPRTTVAPTTVPPTTVAGPKTRFAGDGTYIVGTDIAPGTYRTAGPKSTGSLASCYWERESSLSGNFDSILANENLKGPGVVTIAASDKGFKTSGCQEWTPA